VSKVKNGGLDRYGAEPFKQQQYGTAGIEGVNSALEKIGPHSGIAIGSAGCAMYVDPALWGHKNS